MIKDTLSRAEVYYNISEGIKKGFEWLKTQDLKKLPDGKYFIEEDKIYANIQTYLTKETAPFEAHRKYIDIQYVASGREKFFFADKSFLKISKPYDAQKDVEFYDTADLEKSPKAESAILEAGEFAVFFPDDAHKPSLNAGVRCKVKKILLKIPVL